MTSVAPLLVGAFAFNFNNFVNIYLLTRGGPAMPDSITNAGSTDILISYTYKLAFQSERGQDFGYAAAISVFIFVIVAGISYVNFRLSGAFEETNR
jgi:maltose/maltodextrin transport system permease protein